MCSYYVTHYCKYNSVEARKQKVKIKILMIMFFGTSNYISYGIQTVICMYTLVGIYTEAIIFIIVYVKL